MNDDHLNKLLKSAKIPEWSARAQAEFPKGVIVALRKREAARRNPRKRRRKQSEKRNGTN